MKVSVRRNAAVGQHTIGWSIAESSSAADIFDNVSVSRAAPCPWSHTATSKRCTRGSSWRCDATMPIRHRAKDVRRTQLLAGGVGSGAARAEDGVGTQQSLDAHRGREIGGAQQLRRIDRRQHEHREHPVGAVDEGQALLHVERYGRDARGRQGRAGGTAVAVEPHLAFAHQYERDMGKRREVTAAAERAVLEHNGCEAAVEQSKPSPTPPSHPTTHRQARARDDHRPHSSTSTGSPFPQLVISPRPLYLGPAPLRFTRGPRNQPVERRTPPPDAARRRE